LAQDLVCLFLLPRHSNQAQFSSGHLGLSDVHVFGEPADSGSFLSRSASRSTSASLCVAILAILANQHFRKHGVLCRCGDPHAIGRPSGGRCCCFDGAYDVCLGGDDVCNLCWLATCALAARCEQASGSWLSAAAGPRGPCASCCPPLRCHRISSPR